MFITSPTKSRSVPYTLHWLAFVHVHVYPYIVGIENIMIFIHLNKINLTKLIFLFGVPLLAIGFEVTLQYFDMVFNGVELCNDWTSNVRGKCHLRIFVQKTTSIFDKGNI